MSISISPNISLSKTNNFLVKGLAFEEILNIMSNAEAELFAKQGEAPTDEVYDIMTGYGYNSSLKFFQFMNYLLHDKGLLFNFFHGKDGKLDNIENVKKYAYLLSYVETFYGILINIEDKDESSFDYSWLEYINQKLGKISDKKISDSFTNYLNYLYNQTDSENNQNIFNTKELLEQDLLSTIASQI